MPESELLYTPEEYRSRCSSIVQADRNLSAATRTPGW